MKAEDLKAKNGLDKLIELLEKNQGKDELLGSLENMKMLMTVKRKWDNRSTSTYQYLIRNIKELRS